MPFQPKNRRLTIYDLMEQQGVFASNPANAEAVGEEGQSLYSGPVEYPKMFYHPLGELVEVNPGEEIQTLSGIKLVGQKFEMIHRVAASLEEEQTLRVEGWHDHPSKAMIAAGLDAPPASPQQVITDKDRRIAELEAILGQQSKTSSTISKSAS